MSSFFQKPNGAPGLCGSAQAAALRGMEGVVRSTFHSTALTTTVDYCQAVRAGRAAVRCTFIANTDCFLLPVLAFLNS